MAISTDDLARLRRLIDEPTQVPYSDLTLNTMYMTDGAQDVNLTAAEVWREKASKAASLVDESEGPSSMKLSQLYDSAIKQATYYQGLYDISVGIVGAPRGAKTRAIERA